VRRDLVDIVARLFDQAAVTVDRIRRREGDGEAPNIVSPPNSGSPYVGATSVPPYFGGLSETVCGCGFGTSAAPWLEVETAAVASGGRAAGADWVDAVAGTAVGVIGAGVEHAANNGSATSANPFRRKSRRVMAIA
jgi:hypothetical protein